jgi:hypothetical protein
MKKSFAIYTLLFFTIFSSLEAQIIRNIGRRVQDNLARAVENMVVDKVSQAIVNAAMRPIEKSFDEMLRAAFEADSAYYSTDPAYRDSLRFRTFEAYVQSFNQLADLPDAYHFNLSLSYLVEYEKEKNNFNLRISDNFKQMAMEQSSNQELTVVLMDFERDINVIYTTDKKGKKRAQAVPSMMKLATAYAAKQMEQEEEYTITPTGKTKKIAGYDCNGYLAVNEETETEFYMAGNFPLTFEEAYVKMISNFAPLTARKEYAQLTGMVMESTSKEKKTGKITKMTVTEVSDKVWTIQNADYNFSMD